MKTCFIFGALTVKRMPVLPQSDDIIIAADKGIETVLELGLEPDIIIGDFDSLGYIPQSDNTIVLPVKKDDTDTGYAIKYALERGFDRFFIYGAIGGSLDHTMANLQLAAHISRMGTFAEFFGDDITVCGVTDNSVSFPKTEAGRFSVFAFDEASGVSIKGLEYELEDAQLSPDFPIGVSNAFIGKRVTVEVKSGTLILMWQGDVTASLSC